MAEVRYIAELLPETSGGYSVSFPDVPEIATQGETFGEAVAMAKDALELVVEGMIEEDEALPVASAEGELLTQIKARGAIPAVIAVELPGETVRVNISMDQGLLTRIDRAAERSGRSRSGFLADAAREALKTQVG